jgi:hypothetical protein
MRSNVVYRMNNPSVIGEVLDGEAIIVNLDSGAYYSLTGVGASVWTAALAEATVEQISARVSAEYTGAAAEIAEGVTALIEELIAEGLLVADNVHGAPGLQPAPPDRRCARYSPSALC